MAVIRVEEPLDDEPLLVLGELIGGLFGKHLVAVLCARCQVVQLPEKDRREVDRGVHLGILLQRCRHVVVVFCRMHAHPRPCVHSVRVFAVERLVLVPDKVHVEDVV